MEASSEGGPSGRAARSNGASSGPGNETDASGARHSATTQSSSSAIHSFYEATIFPITFIAAARMSEVTSASTDEARLSMSGTSVLLSGEPGCGKTTLLFQYSLNIAAKAGLRVVLLSSKEKLMQNPPVPEFGMHRTKESILQRIDIRYVSTGAEIISFVARIHEQPPARRPTVILIDDFSSWFRGDKSEIVRALCLLTHTVKWLGGSAGDAPIKPHFVIADTPQLGASTLGYERWVSIVGRIVRHTEPVRTRRQFQLQHMHPTDPTVPLFSLTFTHYPPSHAYLHSDASDFEASSVTIFYYMFRRKKMLFAALEGIAVKADVE
ncbi:hypothetical protein DIPPA_25417 [Diplonema papillatum]|nr:hypothetical protein DIPPA_25417 [Diplonema papillatum]